MSWVLKSYCVFFNTTQKIVCSLILQMLKKLCSLILKAVFYNLSSLFWFLCVRNYVLPNEVCCQSVSGFTSDFKRRVHVPGNFQPSFSKSKRKFFSFRFDEYFWANNRKRFSYFRPRKRYLFKANPLLVLLKPLLNGMKRFKTPPILPDELSPESTNKPMTELWRSNPTRPPPHQKLFVNNEIRNLIYFMITVHKKD